MSIIQKPLHLLVDIAIADTDRGEKVGDTGRGIQEIEVLERREDQWSVGCQKTYGTGAK
jgi:hypothetical protein